MLTILIVISLLIHTHSIKLIYGLTVLLHGAGNFKRMRQTSFLVFGTDPNRIGGYLENPHQ
jgi:hypothetical protein